MFSKNSAPEKKKRFIFWSLLAFYVSLIFYFTPYAYPALKFLMDKTKLNLNLGMSLLGIFMFIYFFLVLIKTKKSANREGKFNFNFHCNGLHYPFRDFYKKSG